MSGTLPEPFTLDGLFDLFSVVCRKAWDDGIARDARPGAVKSVTLPEGVLPGLSQLQNPMDASIVPVRRVPLCQVAEPPALTRTATFAGFLGFEDCCADPATGTVTIQRPGRNRHAAMEGLPLEQLRAALRAMPALPPVSRSARPFTTETQSWLAESAGLGAEDLGREFAAKVAPQAAARAGLPGETLECWLLPVTDFSFRYLITPAGEWPPEAKP